MLVCKRYILHEMFLHFVGNNFCVLCLYSRFGVPVVVMAGSHIDLGFAIFQKRELLNLV